MKFVSKFRNLRVVLMPTRKIFHRDGATNEVEIIPPILAEFQGGIFDTTTAFPLLHQVQEDAGHGDRLESEKKLIHLLKGHPDFGKSYNEFFEASPSEMIAQKMSEIEEIKKQYNLSDETVPGQVGDEEETSDDQENVDPFADSGDQKQGDEQGNDDVSTSEIPSRDVLQKWTYKELQKFASKALGISAVGISGAQLLDMLEERRLELQEGKK